MSVVWSKKGWRRLVLPTKVAYPTCNEEFIYTGNTITPVWTNYDSTAMTISGTQSAVEKGSYTTKFELNEGYIWEDGTTAPYSVTWSIVVVTEVELLWDEDIVLNGQAGAISDTNNNAAAAYGFDRSVYETTDASIKYIYNGLVVAHKDNLEVSVECEWTNNSSTPSDTELWIVKNFLCVYDANTGNRTMDEYEKLVQITEQSQTNVVTLNKGDVLDIAPYQLSSKSSSPTINRVYITYKM